MTSWRFTDQTCWIVGAGASFDCIQPGDFCVPLTKDLLKGRHPFSAGPRFMDELTTLLSSNPRIVDTLRAFDINDPLGCQIELTIEGFRRLASEVTDDGVVAARCLAQLTRRIAEEITFAQGNGLGLGDQYRAFNYFWLRAMCDRFPKWSVISLNYDSLLDWAFAQVPGEVQIQYANWNRLITALLSMEAMPETSDGIYLKLHGSLHLFSCHNRVCPNYRRPWCKGKYPSNVMLFQLVIDEKCPKCGLEMHPLILPPGRNKTKEEGAYHDCVYAKAEAVLFGSNTWLLLGYSMPTYDIDLAAILKRAVEAGHKPVEVCVIDPAANPSLAT